MSSMFEITDLQSIYTLYIFVIWSYYILIFLFQIEIGVGLAGFGISFLLLGMLLLFDKGLLAIGNVSFKK